jgi:translation initiation factor 5B
MAPKGKKSKKQADDDWEAELGESIPPAGEPTENGEQAVNGADDGEETGGGGGGLLAAIRKNKDKRKKKGKVGNDFVEGEDPVQADEQAPDLNGKAPEEATFDDDDDVFAGNANKKPKGGKKEVPKPAEDQDDDDAGAGGVKSKKEKEREKKEREKARKKEQAAKKKTTAPTPAPEAKKEPEKVVEAAAAPAAVPEKDDKSGKKKKVPAHLAALQKQQEALQRQREEAARLEAEEKAEEEARLKKDAEEEQKKAELRERKKQKEKEKKEQLRKEGKLLSDVEKKRQQQQQLRMQQMLASGAQVAGFTEGSEDKKKPVVDKKKKKAPNKHEIDLEAAAEKARQEAEAAAIERERLAKEQAAAAAAAAETVKEEEDSGLEDWEQAAAAEDDVKDSWDADSDEEPAKATKSSPAINGTAQTQQNGHAKTSLPVRSASSAATSSAPTRDDSDSETDESESSEDEELTAAKQIEAKRKAEAAERKKQAHEAALAARSKDNLRSPIACILGHVDTGKTSLLDKIRQTNVQEGEAGGITQQIGATYFPTDALTQKIAPVNKDNAFQFKVPGLLVIDTPGHESFSNLRSRGSSLCNIAILVVDIMHGLEPQTLESMKLLRDRKTPFIVALNKVDRLYDWKPTPNNGFRDSLSKQRGGVQSEFKDRLEKTKVAFAERGFNAEVFYENKNMSKYVSLVPTSAHTGEGIPDMLKLLVSLTQDRMAGSLMYLSEAEGTVLEVKKIEGLGTTIDVILSNGVLREGDRIVICGMDGAITTTIRALLTPAPLKELRLKSAYVHNKEAKASLGVKIAANDLEKAVAGSRLLVVGPDDDESDLEDEVMSDLAQLLTKIDKQSRGVSVHASTLGSLEALLDFLKQMKIPVGNIGLGTVFKKEVMIAGTMLEKNLKEYAVMLCFDVAVDKEAMEYAEKNGVTVFTAEIIYHLFDSFTAYTKKLEEERKEESKLDAVFPAVLSPLQVFNKKDPIVIGVDVIDGNLRLGTPIAAVKHNSVTGVKDVVSLGRV